MLPGDLAAVNGPETLETLLGIAGYLTLTSIFTIGIGFALRSSVGTLSLTYLILIVLPLALTNVGLALLDTVIEYMPGTAGLVLLAGGADPYGRVVAYGGFGLWISAALTVGYRVLQQRDA